MSICKCLCDLCVMLMVQLPLKGILVHHMTSTDVSYITEKATGKSLASHTLHNDVVVIAVKTFKLMVRGRFLCGACFRWAKHYASLYSSLKNSITSLINRYR